MPPRKKKASPESSPEIELIPSSPPKRAKSPRRINVVQDYEYLLKDLTEEKIREFDERWERVKKMKGTPKRKSTPAKHDSGKRKAPRKRKTPSPKSPKKKSPKKTLSPPKSPRKKSPSPPRTPKSSGKSPSPPKSPVGKKKSPEKIKFRDKKLKTAMEPGFKTVIGGAGVVPADILEKRRQLDPTGRFENLRIYQIDQIQRRLIRAKENDTVVDKYFLSRAYDRGVYDHFQRVINDKYQTIDHLKELLCNVYYTPKELDIDITGNPSAEGLQSKEAILEYHLYSLNKEEAVKKLTPLIESWKDGTREIDRLNRVREQIQQYRNLRDEFIYFNISNNTSNYDLRKKEMLREMHDLEKEIGYRDMIVDYDLEIISYLAELMRGKKTINKNQSGAGLQKFLEGKGKLSDLRVKKIRNYIATRIQEYSSGSYVAPEEIGWIELLVNIAETQTEPVLGLPVETSDVYEDTLYNPLVGQNKVKNPFTHAKVPFGDQSLDPKVLERYYELKSDIDYSDKSEMELQYEAIRQTSGGYFHPAGEDEDENEEEDEEEEHDIKDDFSSDDDDIANDFDSDDE